MKYADRTIVANSELHCANCAFFKTHNVFELPCSEVDAKATDTICTKYVFDISKFPKEIRVIILQALHLLHEAHISSRDIQSLLFSSENLPSKFSLGARVWVAYGKGSTASHVCATVVGRNMGKFTLLTESGGILKVTETNLVPYSDLDVATLNFPPVNIESLDKSEKTPSKEVQSKPVTEFRLRGGDDNDENAVRKIVKRTSSMKKKRR